MINFFPRNKKAKVWIWITAILILMIFLFTLFFIFLSSKGDLVLKGDNLDVFIFSKNGNFVVFEEKQYYVGTTNKNTGELEITDHPTIWKISDLNFQNIHQLNDCVDIRGNVFSPSGTKVLCTGELLNEKLNENYSNAVLNLQINKHNSYPYHNLYMYDTKSNQITRLTKKTEDLMHSNRVDPFYAWIDENLIVYRCNPEGVDWLSLPDVYRNNEYNLSTYCSMNLNTQEVTSKVGPPPNFYEGETNVYDSGMGEVRHTLPGGHGQLRDNCLPNFDNSKCVYSVEKYLGESTISYKLYVREGNKEKLVYKSSGTPEAVYWSKDSSLYVSTEDDLRLVFSK